MTTDQIFLRLTARLRDAFASASGVSDTLSAGGVTPRRRPRPRPIVKIRRRRYRDGQVFLCAPPPPPLRSERYQPTQRPWSHRHGRT